MVLHTLTKDLQRLVISAMHNAGTTSTVAQTSKDMHAIVHEVQLRKGLEAYTQAGGRYADMFKELIEKKQHDVTLKRFLRSAAHAFVHEKLIDALKRWRTANPQDRVTFYSHVAVLLRDSTLRKLFPKDPARRWQTLEAGTSHTRAPYKLARAKADPLFAMDAVILFVASKTN